MKLKTLVIGISFLILNACQTPKSIQELKPYKIIYQVQKVGEENKLCSWLKANKKDLVCKELNDFNKDWLLIHFQNLREKFVEVFDELLLSETGK